MINNKEIITSLSALKPIMVIDETTGTLLSVSEWGVPVRKLLGYVKHESERTYRRNKKKLEKECENSKGSANSYGRKLGYRLNNLPKKVLAKSRIQELYLYNLITTVRSYVNSPVETKQPPNFPLKINLGAVDKQMVTLSYQEEERELTLSWKVWDKQLLFIFQTPPHIQKYNITKFCLPTIRENKKGVLVWDFAITEHYAPAPHGSDRVGIDWGVVKPYTMSILNRNKRLVAVYNPSKLILKLVEKKDILVQEKQNINNKIERLIKYKNHTQHPVLEREAINLARKITQLGHQIAKHTAHEITTKISKHHTNTINTENLKWVSGSKGSKAGSNHSFQHARLEQATSHSLARVGVKTKKVNPRNTSQKCSKCGNVIKHEQGKRLIHCADCSLTLDRDVNASINIALNINYKPNKSLGNNRLLRGQNKGITPTLVAVKNTAQLSKPLPIVTITT